MRLAHVPLRLATGVFFLNSGLSKRGAPPEQAEAMQEMATTAAPAVDEMDPQRFAELLSRSELALGSALLTPFVPSWLAGLGLTAFSMGTLRMYVESPAMHQEDSLRPTEEGLGVAKDVWMLAIGLALVLDGFSRR